MRDILITERADESNMINKECEVIRLKICPRCKRQLRDDAKFCDNCGWSFSERRQRKRWYDEKKFENVSLEDVQNWVKANSGRVEIISARGNARYDTKGIFFLKRTFYFPWLTIRYYPDTAGHRYVFLNATEYSGFFKNGDRKTEEDMEEMKRHYSIKKEVFSIVRDSYYSGGGGSKIWFKGMIAEVE